MPFELPYHPRIIALGTGGLRPYNKRMAHIHEKIDFTVGAYIVHPERDKVLLVNHREYNLWLQIGGHVELDEDTDQALMREIEEECGLSVTILCQREGPVDETHKPLYSPNYIEMVYDVTKTGHCHLDLKYFALAHGSRAKLEGSAHREIRWFTKAELESPNSVVIPAVAWHCIKAIEAAQISTVDSKGSPSHNTLQEEA